MRFRSVVDDVVERAQLPEHAIREGSPEVVADKFDSLPGNVFQAVEPPGVRKPVERDNLPVRALDDMLGNVAAGEAGRSRNKYPLHLISNYFVPPAVSRLLRARRQNKQFLNLGLANFPDDTEARFLQFVI